MFAEVLRHPVHMSADQFDAERFRDIVLARVEYLGLTNDKIARLGGPSTTKMSQIRAAKATRPSGPTLEKLDKALRWKLGSARRVSLGGDPVELPAALDLEEALAEVKAAGLSEGTRELILRAWEVSDEEWERVTTP